MPNPAPINITRHTETRISSWRGGCLKAVCNWKLILGRMSTGMVFLLYGTGFIGQTLARRLQQKPFGGHTIRIGQCRLDHGRSTSDEVAESDADFVINAAGRCGMPNVSWCESHQAETLLSNVIGPHNLAAACASAARPLIHISSGCVYSGDNAGSGFGETDPPNFLGSFYSKSKWWAEQLIGQAPGLLMLRIRLPIDQEGHPRNLLTKLLGFRRVISGVKNSARRWICFPPRLIICHAMPRPAPTMSLRMAGSITNGFWNSGKPSPIRISPSRSTLLPRTLKTSRAAIAFSTARS